MASEKDILAMNFDVGGRNVRLADIAEVRREYADPPDPIFRINGTPGLGLAISMRDGGDVLALGENIHHTMEELKADLPIGIEPIMVANQPDTVRHSIDDFMEALWESIAIVLVVSVVSLGLRAGAIVIVCIPLVLAIVFTAMYALGIDLQRISLGALIISLGLLVDDAMITIESMVTRLERGDDKSQAAIFAYASTAYPRLAGTLVTVAAFVPVGFARSDAGEYTFSLFAVVALALLASWVVSGICAPVAGVALLRPPKRPRAVNLDPAAALFRLIEHKHQFRRVAQAKVDGQFVANVAARSVQSVEAFGDLAVVARNGNEDTSHLAPGVQLHLVHRHQANAGVFQLAFDKGGDFLAQSLAAAFPLISLAAVLHVSTTVQQKS